MKRNKLIGRALHYGVLVFAVLAAIKIVAGWASGEGHIAAALLPSALALYYKMYINNG